MNDFYNRIIKPELLFLNLEKENGRQEQSLASKALIAIFLTTANRCDGILYPQHLAGDTPISG